MNRARHAVLLVVLLCGACTSTPNTAPIDEFSATTGIISHPESAPLVVDKITNVILLNQDGTMPRMAVHVHRSVDQPFSLGYRVYRRVRGSDAYVLTEQSPFWRIHRDAFVRPDFIDHIFLGEYRFAIFINQQPWRVVEFKVVGSGNGT
jgi:hypothetical protein